MKFPTNRHTKILIAKNIARYIESLRNHCIYARMKTASVYVGSRGDEYNISKSCYKSGLLTKIANILCH